MLWRLQRRQNIEAGHKQQRNHPWQGGEHNMLHARCQQEKSIEGDKRVKSRGAETRHRWFGIESKQFDQSPLGPPLQSGRYPALHQQPNIQAAPINHTQLRSTQGRKKQQPQPHHRYHHEQQHPQQHPSTHHEQQQPSRHDPDQRRCRSGQAG